MTLAPKTEVYIRLVCERYQPDQPFALPIPHETHPALPSPANSRAISSNSSRALESTLPAHVAIVLTTLDNALVRMPRPSSKCTSDPEVGRIVAGLNTAVNLTLGILSLITTGYWASVSRLRKPHSITAYDSQFFDFVSSTVFRSCRTEACVRNLSSSSFIDGHRVHHDYFAREQGPKRLQFVHPLLCDIW